MTAANRERIAAIGARLDAATPGPWRYEPGAAIHGIGDDDIHYVTDVAAMADDDPPLCSFYAEADAKLVASAPEDLAFLLGYAAELEAGTRSSAAAAERYECENAELRMSLAASHQHAADLRSNHSEWTLRDLLRLAHRRGLRLSRSRTDGDSVRTLHQVWQEPAEGTSGRRWVEVRHWPTRANGGTGPSWRLRINGTAEPTATVHRMAHAELWDPTVPEIVGALAWLGLLDARAPHHPLEETARA